MMSGFSQLGSNCFEMSRTALVVLIIFAAVTAAPVAAEASAKLWLYPDSDDPAAGGHVVTDPAFTLNIENRGSGNGDNTAYGAILLVAVNDLALLTDVSLALSTGTTTLDPTAFGDGLPTFDCDGKTVPPHGVYPTSFAEIGLGDIAEGETIAAGVVINGSEGLEVHFDVKAVSYRQAGPNLKCSNVFNPPGHDVTVVFEGSGGGGDCGGDGGTC